jgi:predicted PurR-regulated permease PerM
VWGLFAGVMNVVPYFGPLAVTAVLAAIGLLQFHTVAGALMVGTIALTITSIEGMLLTPHLLSKAGSLNHVAIFTAIAFWSWAWGASGMLLGVPILMVFKAVCDHVDGLKAVADLLGTSDEREPMAASPAPAMDS